MFVSDSAIHLAQHIVRKVTIMGLVVTFFTSSVGFAEVSYQQKIAQNIERRLNAKTVRGASNCFNTALFVLGVIAEIRSSDGDEVEKLLWNSPDSSYNCRSVDVQGGEQIEYGDLGILARKNTEYSSSILEHAFVMITSDTVFEKANFWEEPTLKNFKDAVSVYDFEGLGPNWAMFWAGPKLTPNELGCRKGATADNIRSGKNMYDSVRSCEIFRCRPVRP